MKQFKLKILPSGNFDFTQKFTITAEYCIIFNDAYIFTNNLELWGGSGSSGHLKDLNTIVCSYPVKYTIIEEIGEHQITEN
jgi:hypothetical protein